MGNRGGRGSVRNQMPNSLNSGLRVRPQQNATAFSYVSAPKVAAAPAPRKSLLKQCAPGPWGQIEFHYLYLEASSELVDVFQMPTVVTRWSFPGMSREEIRGVFLNAGIPARGIERWMTGCLMEQEGVIHILPPIPDLEALTSEQRASIYATLAKSEMNPFHKDPVFVTGGNARDFLRNTDIEAGHAEWFERMCYRRGHVLCFSDVRALLSRARNDSEVKRLFKLCSRTRTLIARLRLTPETDYDSLTAYWSKGGRRKDVLTMLKSVAESPGAEHLDLIHMLPPLPRKLLYSYPPLGLAINGRMPDCHWTSLNFFNYEPREYYIDTRLAASHVIENFAPVDAPYRYGDVLFFMEGPALQAFHSCVFIADDIVFTKNGDNAANPWVLSHLEDLRQVYLSGSGGYVQGYRRK